MRTHRTISGGDKRFLTECFNAPGLQYFKYFAYFYCPYNDIHAYFSPTNQYQNLAQIHVDSDIVNIGSNTNVSIVIALLAKGVK